MIGMKGKYKPLGGACRCRFGGLALCFLFASALLLTGCNRNATPSDASSRQGTEGSTSTPMVPSAAAPAESTGEMTGSTGEQTGGAATASQSAQTTKPTGPKGQMTTTTTKAAATTTKGNTASLSKRKTSSIGFGYYGLAPDRLELDISGAAIIQGDYVNTIIANADSYTLNFCKQNNTRVWASVHSIYDKIANGFVGWEKDFDRMVETAKASGAYDALLGWYLDEPVDQEAVKKLSKYAKEHYGKRFFVCYTVSTVAPQIYTDGIREPVTKDQAQYLTDIAFDMYWGDRARFQAVLDSMKERVGRDDVYIWFIPGCYGNKDLATNPKAAAAELDGWIDQLHMLYDMLKAEKKPGGLMCFAYNFNPDASVENLYGLKQINEGTGGAWKELLAEQIKVGQEICTGKMKGN